MDLIDETIAPENKNGKMFQEHELVLQRLFSLEAEASAMILEAQTQADKKVAEGEKAGSALFEENYAAHVSILEEKFRKKILSVRADCGLKLDEYKSELLAKSTDFAAFSALAGKLLLGKT